MPKPIPPVPPGDECLHHLAGWIQIALPPHTWLISFCELSEFA
jgi:hypothetical protein